MFSLFPAAASPHRHPYYSAPDYPYLSRDYLYALAQQQAKERREAQYRMHLEAVRRRAYQEQLSRAEAARRRNSFVTVLGDYDDEPYSGFLPAQFPRRNQEDNVLPEKRELALEDSMQRPVDQNNQPEQQQTDVHVASPKIVVDIPTAESQAENVPVSVSEPGPDVRDAAARKIQTFIRAALHRIQALRAIAAISQEFTNGQLSFRFPAKLDFDITSNTDVAPSLLFTPRNAPLHGHEHALVKLLSALDAVDSRGDARIRRARKQLVKQIEFALAELDSQKESMWREMMARKTSDLTGTPDNDHASEDAVQSTATPESSAMDLDTSLLDQEGEQDAVESEISLAPEEDIREEAGTAMPPSTDGGECIVQ